MLGTTPVVTVCPAGRRRYLEMLVPHLLRLRGFVDRHDFWVNTLDPGDLAYLAELERAHPGYFRLVHVPNSGFTPKGKPRIGTALHIGAFFPHAAEPGTVYVRFDDDVCFFRPSAIRTLVEHRIRHPEPFLVYPTIINNSIMSHLLQQQGAFGTEHGVCERDLFGRGWHDGRFAEAVHRQFIRALKRGELWRWRLPNLTFDAYERVSINCIAWLGSDMAECADRVGEVEEAYLASERPAELARPNAVCGAAIVSHFAYHTQRDYLDRTNLLSEYRRLF